VYLQLQQCLLLRFQFVLEVVSHLLDFCIFARQLRIEQFDLPLVLHRKFFVLHLQPLPFSCLLQQLLLLLLLSDFPLPPLIFGLLMQLIHELLMELQLVTEGCNLLLFLSQLGRQALNLGLEGVNVALKVLHRLHRVHHIGTRHVHHLSGTAGVAQGAEGLVVVEGRRADRRDHYGLAVPAEAVHQDVRQFGVPVRGHGALLWGRQAFNDPAEGRERQVDVLRLVQLRPCHA